MMKNKIYWHSRKKMWSVLENGRVIAHKTDVFLRDCSFLVNEFGRLRVISEGRKNVHAFVAGFQQAYIPHAERLDWVRVRYNPYAMDQFIRTDNQQPVYTASRVYMDGLGNVFADKPT